MNDAWLCPANWRVLGPRAPCLVRPAGQKQTNDTARVYQRAVRRSACQDKRLAVFALAVTKAGRVPSCRHEAGIPVGRQRTHAMQLTIVSRTIISQARTLLHFAVVPLMPWTGRIGKAKPEHIVWDDTQ